MTGEKQSTGRRLKIVLIVLLLFSLSFVIFLSTRRSEHFPFKAAIVDHLSFTGWTNQSFVNTSTTMLESAGFDVDYYEGEEVTVDFYRNLPSRGYGLIILRVHTAWLRVAGEECAILYTCEPYEPGMYADYPGLVIAYYSRDEPYFGIGPGFIRALDGSFSHTMVIMMGCNGLRNPEDEVAKAFVEKGAKVYISWSLEVLATHTDAATTRLVEHLLLEKQTVKDAVRETMNEVGPDPFFNSTLLYYPDKAGDYSMPLNAAFIMNETSVSYVAEWLGNKLEFLKVKASLFSLTHRT